MQKSYLPFGISFFKHFIYLILNFKSMKIDQLTDLINYLNFVRHYIDILYNIKSNNRFKYIQFISTDLLKITFNLL